MPRPILTGYEIVTVSIASTTPTQVDAPVGMFVAWAFARDEDTDGHIRTDAELIPLISGSGSTARVTGVIFTMPNTASVSLRLVCVGQ